MLDKNKGVLLKLGKAFLWIYSFVTVFVFIYLFYKSLRSRSDILSNVLGVPKGLGFDNFIRLFRDNQFFRYFGNSVLILVVSLLITVTLSATVAYGLGRYKFKGNRFLRVYFLIGMMFPIQLGIVPIFLLMRDIKLLDSYWSVILVLSAGISMAVFLLTEFFARLPKEVYESAVMDGAGEWTTFLRIMFPLASPIVFSSCIVTSVQIWNQFFVPLIFLQSETKKTVPLIVVKFTKNLLNTMDMALAASVMATVPILILFVIFSEKILDGVASGAVKG